jgi:hypothetical protein
MKSFELSFDLLLRPFAKVAVHAALEAGNADTNSNTSRLGLASRAKAPSTLERPRII